MTDQPPTPAELLEQADALDAQASDLRARAQGLRREADRLFLQARPTFPTPEHVEGIAAAVALILGGAVAESHHGDPCAPGPNKYAVTWQDVARRISVRHGSGLTSTRDGHRLWRFSPGEIEALLAVVREAGAEPVDHWSHDEGVSILIRRP